MKHPSESNISTLPLLTEAERHTLLVEWNDTCCLATSASEKVGIQDNFFDLGGARC